MSKPDSVQQDRKYEISSTDAKLPSDFGNIN